MEGNITDVAEGLQGLPLSDEEFHSIRRLVYERFGISLSDEKRSLVSGRLRKVVLARGFASFKEYHDFVVRDATGAALEELATRISTNHTFFYREHDHFEFFAAKALPAAAARHQRAGSRDLRIWSAGCSSGEEPYTLVMLMLEHFGREYGQWQAGVLATDISSQALAAARAGVYAEERLEPLPPALKHKYFRKTGEGQYAVSEQVRREVTFRTLNLMSERFPFKKQFDLIFCRNVMIYFDQPTRERLVRKLFDALAPGGYFFIGHSESLRQERCGFDYVMPALYHKREGA